MTRRNRGKDELNGLPHGLGELQNIGPIDAPGLGGDARQILRNTVRDIIYEHVVVGEIGPVDRHLCRQGAVAVLATRKGHPEDNTTRPINGNSRRGKARGLAVGDEKWWLIHKKFIL